jgi:protein-tyrosine kinase
MGRIDDALRRGGRQRAEFPVSEAVGADVFVSPWTVGDNVEPGLAQTSSLRPVVEPPSLIKGFNPQSLGRLAVSTQADPMLAHQFGRLTAILLAARRRERLKSVMITSAAPHDGKTLTSLNLAAVLSESYQFRVLLIEGDLRRPGIALALNLQVREGLSTVLKATDDRKVPLIRLTDSLTLLPAGRPDPDPLSGLTSPRMQRFLQDATEQFDWVILDTPPLGATADAGLLCPLVDAVVLVVRARKTACAGVQSAIETLGRGRILGVVLNGVDRTVVGAYEYGYGYGYGHSGHE